MLVILLSQGNTNQVKHKSTREAKAYIHLKSPTISDNRRAYNIIQSYLYQSKQRDFTRVVPRETSIILRPRYAYIIILYNYNIIYIIFPRLLLFPSSTLCLGKILWPSSYFSTQDSCSVCTSVSVSVSVLFKEKPILLLGKNLLLFYFWKNPFVGKKPFSLHRGWSLSGTFYSFIFGKTHFCLGKNLFHRKTPRYFGEKKPIIAIQCHIYGVL